jgi:lipopolysaccharide biosynthesis glycosyltransferase
MGKGIYNILVTLDENYLRPLTIMLQSILLSHPNDKFNVFVMHDSLTENNFKWLNRVIDDDKMQITSIFFTDFHLNEAPTSSRFPKVMYYRLFAPFFLPKEMDRILYLDPDLVIIKPFTDLYNQDFQNNCLIASTHVFKWGQKFNAWRLKMNQGAYYVNSGIFLMNLEKIREIYTPQSIYSCLQIHRYHLILPDQDILSVLYEKSIGMIDPLVYNLSDRYRIVYNFLNILRGMKINKEWIELNTIIIHYCGRNKPWKKIYFGILSKWYTDLKNGIEDRW